MFIPVPKDKRKKKRRKRKRGGREERGGEKKESEAPLINTTAGWGRYAAGTNSVRYKTPKQYVSWGLNANCFL